MKNNSSFARPHKRAIGGKIRLGSSRLNEAAILHSWSDKDLVKIEHGKRSQLLSGVADETDHFPSIFIDGPLEVQ